MKSTTTLFFLLTFVLNHVSAQDCYTVISDFSGFNTSQYLESLKTKSCELVDSMPAQFREDFKVIDFGFYSISEFTPGGFQTVWENVKLNASNESLYYLLIGKQTDRTGIYSKFWVDVQLPSTGVFECYEPEHKAFITNKINTVIEDRYNALDRVPFRYNEAQLAGMDSLISIINKAKECCIPSDGFKNFPTQCTPCPDDVEFIESLLAENGFNSVDIESMSIKNKSVSTEVKTENAEMTVSVNGQMINVNDDIGQFVDKLASGMEGVQADILFYDPFSYDCLDVMASILGTEFEDPPGLNNRKETKNNASSEYLYKTWAIGTTDSNGNSKLHIKTKVNYTPTNAGKTIYLQNLDGCCIDLEEIKNYLTNFYSLLGDFTFEKPEFSGNNVTVSLIPDIEISTFLLADHVRDNTLVLFGEGSQLIDAAQGYYEDISIWSNDALEFEGVCRFLSQTGLLETAETPGNISLVRSNLENDYLQWKTSSVDHLASYLAFHATGHNAGIQHYANPTSQGFQIHSYMSSGCCTLRTYFSRQVPCQTGCSIDIGYNNPEEMVTETIGTGNYFYSILKPIYERYIE